MYSIDFDSNTSIITLVAEINKEWDLTKPPFGNEEERKFIDRAKFIVINWYTCIVPPSKTMNYTLFLNQPTDELQNIQVNNLVYNSLNFGYEFNVIKYKNKLYQPSVCKPNCWGSGSLQLCGSIDPTATHIGKYIATEDCLNLLSFVKYNPNNLDYYLTPLDIGSKKSQLTLDNVLEQLYDISHGKKVEYEKEFLLEKYKQITGEKYKWI